MNLTLKTKERIRTNMERMWDTDIVSEAADFCHEAHKGQYRKGTIIPFEEHPLRVGSVVSYHQGTQNQVIAGYLHDVVEDTDKTIEDVAEKFGDEVAHIVAALSEDKSLPTWKERKLDYIQKISAPENEDAVLVSMVDKVDNLYDTSQEWEDRGDKVFLKFNAGKEEQSWFYRALVDVYRDAGFEEQMIAMEALLSEMGM